MIQRSKKENKKNPAYYTANSDLFEQKNSNYYYDNIYFVRE